MSRYAVPLFDTSMTRKGDVIYLKVDGVERRYIVHRPARAPASPAVVLMLDGRGGTPWTAMKSAGWNEKADAAGFLAVYPEALRLDPARLLHHLDNPQVWNAGHAGADAGRGRADDVAFLAAVLDDVRERFAVDEARVYLTGFSNGGSMVFRFAQTYPERVAAIAPVAAHFAPVGQALASPVPMLYIAGAQDPLNPPAGGTVDLPWKPRSYRAPIEDTVQAWASMNAAGAKYVVNLPRISIHRYGNHDPSREVLYYLVRDLGHVWPGGTRLLPENLVGRESDALDGTDVIWNFFSRHARSS